MPHHLDFPATSILHGDDDHHSDPLLLVPVHPPLNQGLIESMDAHMPLELEFSGNCCL